MKRSEMIEILDKHFNDVCYQDYIPDSHLVLHLLECAGMLPPDNGKEAYDILDYRSKCLKWDEE